MSGGGDIIVTLPAVIGLATANVAANVAICTAGAVDGAAMSSAATTALGPNGAVYLSAYLPAQALNMATTQILGVCHGAIGAVTDAAGSALHAAGSSL